MKICNFFAIIILFILTVNDLFCQSDTISISTDTSAVKIIQSTPERIDKRKMNVVMHTDTTDLDSLAVASQEKKKHSPTTAILLSIVPGGGQIYNKKWWKVPIFYAGLAASGHFIATNAIKTIEYRNELFFRSYEATEYYNPNLAKYTTVGLQENRNQSRRIMEISIGICAIVYALNLIDALVDAHLFYFDVSDDLSMQLAPMIQNNTLLGTLSTGVTFSIKF